MEGALFNDDASLNTEDSLNLFGVGAYNEPDSTHGSNNAGPSHDNDDGPTDPPENGASGSKSSGPSSLVPKWMTNAEEYLRGVDGGGEGWDVVLGNWLLLEERLGYPDSQVSLLALSRCFVEHQY